MISTCWWQIPSGRSRVDGSVFTAMLPNMCSEILHQHIQPMYPCMIYPMLHAQNAKLHAHKSLCKIPQLRQLIQQRLQVIIGDFVLKTGDQRLGLLGIVTAQTACSRSVDTSNRQTGALISGHPQSLPDPGKPRSSVNHSPSCDRSNISSSVCELSNRSTALMFSSSLKRAKTSR